MMRQKEHPRAVLGYTDLAARANVGKTIPENMLTFAVPFSLFTEMEEEAKDGVFDGPIWKGLAASNEVTIMKNRFQGHRGKAESSIQAFRPAPLRYTDRKFCHGHSSNDRSEPVFCGLPVPDGDRKCVSAIYVSADTSEGCCHGGLYHVGLYPSAR